MGLSWRHQDLISAPVDEVWELITDPARYPEWSAGTIEVTGAPQKIEKGSTYRQTTESPVGPVTTTFLVEELDDLHELKLRCTDTGYYSHWVLTEARGETFTDVEFGVEPQGRWGEEAAQAVDKGYLRNMAQQVFDGIRSALGAGRLPPDGDSPATMPVERPDGIRIPPRSSTRRAGAGGSRSAAPGSPPRSFARRARR